MRVPQNLLKAPQNPQRVFLIDALKKPSKKANFLGDDPPELTFNSHSADPLPLSPKKNARNLVQFPKGPSRTVFSMDSDSVVFYYPVVNLLRIVIQYSKYGKSIQNVVIHYILVVNHYQKCKFTTDSEFTTHTVFRCGAISWAKLGVFQVINWAKFVFV